MTEPLALGNITNSRPISPAPGPDVSTPSPRERTDAGGGSDTGNDAPLVNKAGFTVKRSEAEPSMASSVDARSADAPAAPETKLAKISPLRENGQRNRSFAKNLNTAAAVLQTHEADGSKTHLLKKLRRQHAAMLQGLSQKDQKTLNAKMKALEAEIKHVQTQVFDATAERLSAERRFGDRDFGGDRRWLSDVKNGNWGAAWGGKGVTPAVARMLVQGAVAGVGVTYASQIMAKELATYMIQEHGQEIIPDSVADAVRETLQQQKRPGEEVSFQDIKDYLIEETAKGGSNFFDAEKFSEEEILIYENVIVGTRQATANIRDYFKEVAESADSAAKGYKEASVKTLGDILKADAQQGFNVNQARKTGIPPGHLVQTFVSTAISLGLTLATSSPSDDGYARSVASAATSASLTTTGLLVGDAMSKSKTSEAETRSKGGGDFANMRNAKKWIGRFGGRTFAQVAKYFVEGAQNSDLPYVSAAKAAVAGPVGGLAKDMTGSLISAVAKRGAAPGAKLERGTSDIGFALREYRDAAFEALKDISVQDVSSAEAALDVIEETNDALDRGHYSRQIETVGNAQAIEDNSYDVVSQFAKDFPNDDTAHGIYGSIKRSGRSVASALTPAANAAAGGATAAATGASAMLTSLDNSVASWFGPTPYEDMEADDGGDAPSEEGFEMTLQDTTPAEPVATPAADAGDDDESEVYSSKEQFARDQIMSISPFIQGSEKAIQRPGAAQSAYITSLKATDGPNIFGSAAASQLSSIDEASDGDSEEDFFANMPDLEGDSSSDDNPMEQVD